MIEDSEVSNLLEDPPSEELGVILMEWAKALRGRAETGDWRALVQLRWHFWRDHATEPEQTEAFEMARRLASEDPSDAETIYTLGLLTCERRQPRGDVRKRRRR